MVRSDELLNGEIFYTLREAQIIIESWRRHYNTVRPHTSLEYKPPAPKVFVPALAAWPAALRRPAPPATLAPTQSLSTTIPTGPLNEGRSYTVMIDDTSSRSGAELRSTLP